MASKRLISDENKESSERANVSEPQPSTTGFTGITPREKLLVIFMDGDLSSDNLSPPPHPSPLLFYVICHQHSLTLIRTVSSK
ncbi:hypothetical protein E2C01_102490 [Portunus trituberculatus]|uniref:Uncharacterized protein n=1 Tax=Portunus trituberculatus TaxID=210409 RepID=A0A5B7KIK5_PORTR|nr:hypothetical protein [Portunus trituberculatus]